MNLVEAILELKKLNRELHKYNRSEYRQKLCELQEYIENMEVPELLNLREEVQIIDIIDNIDHSLRN